MLRSPSACNGQEKTALTFSFAIGVFLCLAPVSATATDHSGISIRFYPSAVQPGDVSELIVQMDRQTFGEFELHVPSHPQLHLVSMQRAPVSFEDGRYRQRQILILQPLSSGKVTINEAQVEFTDSNGPQSILLPAATLDVLPFNSADLSDVPQSLPAAGHDVVSTTMPIVYGAVLLVCILIIAVVIAYRMRMQTSITDANPNWEPTLDAIERLQSGEIPIRLLERILVQDGYDLSPELRREIEHTVYGKRREPAALVALLRKETVH
ncbi:hypothetical protein [Novipirellula artificiosorum]|uniref:Uncharacterized protein n=1 Tax=Novipirellula artificiosorum TaxID=2528016 RepID=A0A5C6DTW6_9BACT|nr:hypothetical protein [Novipirellula artificiosorum]TWU38219.1 hypothetical protein Poly41_26950 [Novipirellula artificiosorum]